MELLRKEAKVKRIDYLNRAALAACALFFAGAVLLNASPSFGQTACSGPDCVYFTKTDSVSAALVNAINAETVRIDMSTWYLDDFNVYTALLNRFKAGVPVRLIGDRGSIFEIDAHTRSSFEYLASQGVPIRLRYNPTWYPEIDHWKATMFVGQKLVEFGSPNYTTFELAPWSSTNFNDENALFTSDSTLFNAMESKFDQYWNDTRNEPESQQGPGPYFKNWDDACKLESACSDYYTTYPNPAPMVINTARLFGDFDPPADLIFGQGPDFNDRLITEINKETTAVDGALYRLTVDDLTQALLAKFQARVPMRLFIEPNEYVNRNWPEFWLTHANIDKLWAAGVPIKMRTHDGNTHMKTIITSAYATIASSNFSFSWQRDHDYFVSAATKPVIYAAVKNNFQSMWTDTANYTTFVPLGPDSPNLSAPSSGQTSVVTTPTLVWNREVFATSYDVYLGTSQNSLALVGNVPAVMTNSPPLTYSWTPTTALAGGTTYFWKIVSRTNATPKNPNLIAPSSVWTFTTAASATNPPGTPGSAVPANGATSVSTSPTLTWSASGATSYDVNFGTSSTPPQVTSAQAAASYTPSTLAASTTYFWQIVARNSAGTTTGPVWSFTTGTSAGGGALPAPWQTQDVGSTGQTGSAAYSSGTFTVRGAGADIWDTTDAFRYVYQAVSGDFQLVARVASMQNTQQWAKAGLMLRASNAANSAHVMLDETPSGAIEFMTRTSTGAVAQIVSNGSQPIPAWLRLTRSGNTVSADISANGSSWTPLGSTTVAFTSANVGLVVCSHDATTLNTSTFDNVAVTSGGGTPPPPPPPTAANIVIYGSDVPASVLHGTWALVNDASSPNGTKLATTDAGVSNTDAPLASPTQYFDVSFTAQANTPYTIWLRMKALNNSKFNDSLFVQFSDAQANGGAIYPIGTTQGLDVNLATNSGGSSLNGWGWQNGAYWLSQTTTVTFPTTGTHTLRIQIREDGVELDQIVLSPTTYLNSAPGPATNDSTIVPKP